MNQEFEQTIISAFREAKNREHEYLTVEHLLFSLLQNENGRHLIERCGGNITTLIARLENYFSAKIPKLKNGSNTTPTETIAFQRLIQRTLIQVQMSEKPEAEIGDLLAAIFAEDKSYACFFLREQKIKRLDILRLISSGDESAAHPENSSSELLGKDSTLSLIHI